MQSERREKERKNNRIVSIVRLSSVSYSFIFTITITFITLHDSSGGVCYIIGTMWCTQMLMPPTI